MIITTIAKIHNISKPSYGFHTWIANFNATLSMASSFVIFQSFMSFIMDSSDVKFALLDIS